MTLYYVDLDINGRQLRCRYRCGSHRRRPHSMPLLLLRIIILFRVLLLKTLQSCLCVSSLAKEEEKEVEEEAGLVRRPGRRHAALTTSTPPRRARRVSVVGRLWRQARTTPRINLSCEVAACSPSQRLCGTRGRHGPARSTAASQTPASRAALGRECPDHSEGCIEGHSISRIWPVIVQPKVRSSRVASVVRFVNIRLASRAHL